MARSFEPGRRHAPSLHARQRTLTADQASGFPSVQAQAGLCRLAAPTVGMITAMAGPGERLQPGDAFAKLSQLGRVYSLIVPPGAVGLVVASALAPEGGRLGQCEVAFDQPLLLLDPSAGAHADLAVSSSRAQSQSSGQAFLSPSSGRFYQRPSPDRPPFLQVGQTIKQGQTVGLLEIMKTFTRIPFSGPGLPQEVKVVELLAQDDDELASGDPIFRFESV